MKLTVKAVIIICVGISLPIFVSAQQEPLKPNYEKALFEKEGKYFVQKSLPLYLKFSLTPDGKDYPLKSTEHPSDANPVYLNSEGLNHVRTKCAVDPITRKPVTPQREAMMDVYSDGVAPTSYLKLDGAPHYQNGGVTYYGKGLNFSITAHDEVSGVMETKYSLSGNYLKYSGMVGSISEGANMLYYFSADNVGNVENSQSRSFTVDVTPPSSSHIIKGIQYGENILSPSTTFKLLTNDNLSGVNMVYYSLDKDPHRAYVSSVDLDKIPDGQHILYYHAVDNVKNEAVKSSFNFYLDKTAPVATIKVIGDQYMSATHMYVSARTKINLSATDNKAGVRQIYYRHNGKELINYMSDFDFPNTLGLHTIEYDAIDNVENLSENKYLTAFMDNRKPETGIVYGEPQFFTRDTLFTTSQTPVMLMANDGQSGLKAVNYAVDGGNMQLYQKFTIPGNGPHRITFNAIDNVNNEEDKKASNVFVDNLPPEIFLNFSIEPIGKKGNLNIYPNYVRLYIGATDKHVGTEKLLYSIDGGPLTNYSSAQTLDISELDQFKDQKKYKLRIVSEDKLGNKSEKFFEFYVGRNNT